LGILGKLLKGKTIEEAQKAAAAAAAQATGDDKAKLEKVGAMLKEMSAKKGACLAEAKEKLAGCDASEKWA